VGDLRQIRRCAAVVIIGAVIVCATLAAVHIGYDVWILPRYGISGPTIRTIALLELRAHALLLPIIALLLWGAASWRLAAVVSAAGMAALGVASGYVIASFFFLSWSLAGVLVAAAAALNVFLRIWDRIYLRMETQPLDEAS
jgi:hypothetical protein